jgi:hypothetical protein
MNFACGQRGGSLGRARSGPPGISSMRRARAEFGRRRSHAALHWKWRIENHFYLLIALDFC